MAKNLNNFKAPPPMRPELTYIDWKKEMNIWRKFTDLDKKKQGGALFLSLDDKARKTVLAEVPESAYDSDNIVDIIIKSLDKLLLKDDSETAFQAFDNFIKFRRPKSMTIDNFLAEFNLKYTKIKGHKMDLPDGVLAYAVLTCANLPEDQNQLCRATCNELKYDLMRKQIEKVTLETFCKTTNEHDNTNTQSTFYESDQYTLYENTEEEKTLYEYEEPFTSEHDETETKETYYMPRPYRQQYAPRGSPTQHRSYGRHTVGQHGNPLDSMGHPITCRFCKSTYHMLLECPHAPSHMKERQPPRGRGGFRGNRGGRGQGFNVPISF